MTTYHVYYRGSTGATWTEENRYCTWRYERQVNQPSTVVIVLRECGGTTAEDWTHTSIGKHILITSATFSGTTGANTIWHGRVRNPMGAGFGGTMSLTCEDWLGQLYDERDRYTTRRSLRTRTVSGYGERAMEDEMRFVTAYSGTTITDASATGVSADEFNDTCAVVFTEVRDEHRTRTIDDDPVTDIKWKPWAHLGGSARNVGVSDNWNSTTMDTNSLVLCSYQLMREKSYQWYVAEPKMLFHLAAYTIDNATTVRVEWGVYAETDATCATVTAQWWNDTTQNWSTFTGTTVDGGTAWAGTWTSDEYRKIYYTIAKNVLTSWFDDQQVMRLRFLQSTASSSQPKIAINYTKITVTLIADQEVRQVAWFPITDCRITGDTCVYASSVNFESAGVATNDVYTVAKRSDLYVQDLVADGDYLVTLSTSGVAQNPIQNLYPNLEWMGASRADVIGDLAKWDRTDFWLDPTTDIFYYNADNSFDSNAGPTLSDSSDPIQLVDWRYDYDQLYYKAEVFGHEWSCDDTKSGIKFQVRFDVTDEDVENDYRTRRTWSHVHPGILGGAPAKALARAFLSSHNKPRRRVKIRYGGRCTSVGLGDAVRVAIASADIDELLYCWRWVYDQQIDSTELDLVGPVDSWTTLRPDALASYIAEVRRISKELEMAGGTSGSRKGGSISLRPTTDVWPEW